MMSEENTLGLYIHIPFCKAKCPYCDFYSVVFSEDKKNKYVDAICRNIKAYSLENKNKVDTIYFGGGTPSLLSAKDIDKILSCAEKFFSFSDFPEITMECNPESTSKEKITGYKSAGINRLSIGVQSLCDKQLEYLGRLHDASTARQVILDADSIGMNNISCDIMLATPHQNPEILSNTIRQLAELPVQHISAYLLKIESGTKYFNNKWVSESVPDDDEASDLYLQTVEMLGSYGFKQYEISNFAKSGYESRHNIKYWECKPYLGIGASSHSDYRGKRFYVPSDIDSFIESSMQKTIIEDENPDREEERVFLGMRLSKGIPVEWIQNKNQNKIKSFCDAGFLKCEDDRVAFTPKGFLVSNTILASFCE